MERIIRVLSLVFAFCAILILADCKPKGGGGGEEEEEELTCIDNDADTYGENCAAGADCNDNDPNNWTSCSTCGDSDQDNYYTGCDSYHTISGPDCDDADRNNWTNCANCKDNDEDGYFAGCDAYTTIQGPDCGDADENNWNSCATCRDNDGDEWFSGCDSYATIEGPDCDDTDANEWVDCTAECVDADGDGFYVGCDEYTTVDGPDCNDTNNKVYPGASELCDGVDNQCPGDAGYDVIDEGCSWARVYGGVKNDEAYSVQQTSDGGYIVGGLTWSYAKGKSDGWVLKLNSDGSKAWDRAYGGNDEDTIYSIKEMDSYIAVGYTLSYGQGGFLSWQVWVLKLDSQGNIIWDKNYGGIYHDYGYSIYQSYDKGYIIAGETWYGSGLNSDLLLLRLDSFGYILWERKYGDSANQIGYSVIETPDGKYVVAGTTNSGGLGGYDVWLLKVDCLGNKIWDKVYGGPGDDVAYSLQLTSDLGYIMLGYTKSFGVGGSDFYLVRTNPDGNFYWHRTYGYPTEEVGRSIQQTPDGGYIAAGYALGTLLPPVPTPPPIVTDPNDTYDYLVVKLDRRGFPQLFNQGTIYQRWGAALFGGGCNDQAFSIDQTSDGGYVVTGLSYNTCGGEDNILTIKIGNDLFCSGSGCPCMDVDGDGWWTQLNCVAGIKGQYVDCNDNDPSIYPFAPNPNAPSEFCDGKDNQCPGDPGSGIIDEGCDCISNPASCACRDEDGDRYYTSPGCPHAIDLGVIDPNDKDPFIPAISP